MSPKAPFGAFVFHITICKPKENVIGSDSRSHIALDFAPVWAHRESRIPFSSIQNHDNTEQARIYPAKLKHIVPRRQSAIIAGLNKCFQRVSDAGLRFPLCSPPLVGMYLCSLPSDHPGRGREARPRAQPCRGLVLLAEVGEGRCRYQTGPTAPSFPSPIRI